MLLVRWWWLRGIRARQAGRADEALACFRRCEQALKGGGKRQRQWRCQTEGSGSSGGESDGKSGEEEEDKDEEAVVLLPYCAVHPRIDLQVKMGIQRSLRCLRTVALAASLKCTAGARRVYIAERVRVQVFSCGDIGPGAFMAVWSEACMGRSNSTGADSFIRVTSFLDVGG